MHRALVGGGHVSGVVFWSLPPGQVWWIIDDNQPEEFESQTDYAAIRQMVKKAKEAEANDKDRR